MSRILATSVALCAVLACAAVGTLCPTAGLALGAACSGALAVAAWRRM